jgi:hypothetical protein
MYTEQGNWFFLVWFCFFDFLLSWKIQRLFHFGFTLLLGQKSQVVGRKCNSVSSYREILSEGGVRTSNSPHL